MSKTIAGVLTLLLCATTAGCAADTPATNSSSTPSIASSPSAPDSSLSPTESSPSDSTLPVETASVASTPTPSDGVDEASNPIPSASGEARVLQDDRAGQSLRLADFAFVDGSWKDGAYSLADKDVNGIATSLSGCYTSDNDKLQLRLGKRFKELALTVGQGNGGKSVHDQVLVQILTNGGNQITKSVSANNSTAIKIPVQGINSVELTFNLNDQVKGCGENGDVQVVLYDIVATK